MTRSAAYLKKNSGKYDSIYGDLKLNVAINGENRQKGGVLVRMAPVVFLLKRILFALLVFQIKDLWIAYNPASTG
jgi:hypothetical protein